MTAIFEFGLVLNIVMAFWIRGEVNQNTLRIPKNIQYLTWDRRKVTSVTWEEQAPTRFLAFSTYAKIGVLLSMVMFCIASFGSYIATEWIIYAGTIKLGDANFWSTWFSFYFFGVLPVIMIYVLQHVLLKLSNFDRIYPHVIFILTYIVSILFWNGALR